MKITLQYTAMTITLESKDIDSTVDIMLLSGTIVEKLFLEYDYGKPKHTVELHKFDRNPKLEERKPKATH